MNTDLWSEAVNLLAAGTAWSSVKTTVEASSMFPSAGEATLMDAAFDTLVEQAMKPVELRADWYRASSPQASGTTNAAGVPNLISGQDFDTSPWTMTSATLTNDRTQADPFGGTTASKITLANASAEHKIAAACVGTQFGFYAKAGTGGYIGISNDGGTTYSVFNLSSGAITHSTPAPAFEAVTVIPNATGWYFCQVEFAAATTLTISFGDDATHAIPGTSWAAAGTETFYLCKVMAVA